jgi:biopolymer transport protein ExbB
MKRITYLLICASLFSYAFAAPQNEMEPPQAIEEELDDFLVESELEEIAQDFKEESSLENDDFFANLEEAAKSVEPIAQAPAVTKTAQPIAQPSAALPKETTTAATPVVKQKKAEVAPVAPKKIAKQSTPVQISFDQVFSGSPIIYSVLFFLSIAAMFIWLYAQTSIRSLNALTKPVISSLRNQLSSNQYDDALALCQQHNNFFCRMVASGILSRAHGIHVISDVMKAEGKRATMGYWQKIALLNDIAIIAPMIGLLGTVLGMFYAFYDLNRSMESIASLFDGLGVSVGTTVAGLIVAILAMILHSLSKYRLTRVLSSVENEANALAILIDQRTFAPQDK